MIEKHATPGSTSQMLGCNHFRRKLSENERHGQCKITFANMVTECDKNVISHALLAFPSISAGAKNKILKLYIDVLLNVSCKIVHFERLS